MSHPQLQIGIEEQAAVTAAFISDRWPQQPELGVVLGTGLGAFADPHPDRELSLDVEAVFPYEELPHFPRSTAIGHRGRLVAGNFAGRKIIVLQGRCHRYEGYDIDDVTFAIRVLHALRIEQLVLTCAAGGLERGMVEGQFMAITEHIDMQHHPAQREIKNLERSIYSPDKTRELLSTARELNIRCQPGTYIAVTGPNYETRAELRFFQTIGDAIGMSTAPEARLAAQLGMDVTALATITNLCNPDQPHEADGAAVVCVASQVEPQFRELMACWISQC